MATAVPVLVGMTGISGSGDSVIDVPVTGENRSGDITGTEPEWVTVTMAMSRLGVTRRTVRRWIAAGGVVSRLETVDGREVRLIRGDTLPAVMGHVRDDVADDCHGDALSPGAAAVTGDDTDGRHGDDHETIRDGRHGDDLRELVTHQSGEIAFLRQQLEARTQAEAELRRLLLVSQQALAAAIERPMLPLAHQSVQPVDTRSRLRWFWPFRRRA